MSPKIDYALLGRAVHHYKLIGYEYVEVPWAVDDIYVDTTCPTHDRTLMVERRYDAPGDAPRDETLSLVGSAEQGFLAMDLSPGLYVGVTPCFRVEDKHDLLYQPWFMKVELFDNRDQLDGLKLLTDAQRFMQSETKAPVTSIITKVGVDLMIGGIEVGSYGGRTIGNLRPWRYGTGLALPRFSVASAVHLLDS